MDPASARLLALRIKAGVFIGGRIELVDDVDDESGLRAGDRGVVDDIDEQGMISVTWDRGCVAQIDPERTRFRRIAA